MTGTVRPKLPIIDEGLFYQLIAGPGRVQIDITRIDRYFLPFVSFKADDDAQSVLYGAIILGKRDLLATETELELTDLIIAMTGDAPTVKINPPTSPDLLAVADLASENDENCC